MAAAVPMPLDLTSPNRRLWFAIGISILLHGTLLTLNFQFPDASRMMKDKALEIILVNSKSARKPSDAQALAPLGIHATAIEPGFFRTDVLEGGSSLSKVRRELADYAETVGRMRTFAAGHSKQQPGDPAKLATDVGPVIDREAFEGIRKHLQRLNSESKCLIPSAKWSQGAMNLIPPAAFEVPSIASVQQEIFGPVLHIVRWSGDPQAVIGQINALGYGLTLGIQTRIDSRAQAMARAAHVGNVYINRNMIGAVVGVQPFGGEGLSGTGPKAGGPHYLMRFCAEQTVTVNTTAAGGNVQLLA